MTSSLNKPTSSTFSARIRTYLPILSWLPNYQTSWLRADIVAAITIWALLVPEAMAYAGIAGMPPETGLYAAPLPMLIYAILGSSPHLTVGPSSTVAALSFSVIGGMAVVGSANFITLSILLAMIVGGLLIGASFLRLGLLADFLSRPVLDGFVVGVAISIAIGQLDKLFGFAPISNYNFIPDVLLFVRDVGLIHWPTFIVGAVSLAMLFLLHHFVPKIPAPLVVLVLAIGLSYAAGFETMGIHIVGEIPAGVPPFGVPEGITFENILQLLPGALGVALVGFAESIAIARSFGVRFGYEVDANQELLAIGASNLGSSVSGGFVIDGSMSRTSASVESGARSQMVGLIAAAAIFITALAFTPLFHYLPEATLGAIVIHAVWHSIRFRKIMQYRHITNLDFATAVVALFGVLVLGLLEGLLLAAGLGLVVLLFNTKRRATTLLGAVPGTDVYRSLANYPDAETFDGLLLVRFDGTLFFANAHDFRSALRELVASAETKPHVILLDCESMNDIDATAVITLIELEKELTRNDISLRLARAKTGVRQIMQRAGLEEAVAPNHWYTTITEGVEAYQAETRR